jgi:hypothetical protein
MAHLFTRCLLFACLLTCLSLNLQAQQQLPNNGFENWQNVGSNDEEPTDWNSNKTGGGFASLGPQTCFREASGVYAGSYCVRLETGRVLGNEVNGTITTGRLEAPNTNPNNGYAQTVRNDADFNHPFSGRPDSLVGYYKYTSVNGDGGAFQVILHGDADVRMPDPNNSTSAFIVGEAAFDTPTANVGSWTRFSVPFVYNNTDTPQYVLAIFTSSSDPGSAERGSTLWIDEVELIYNPIAPPPCANTDTSFSLMACKSQLSPSGAFTWTASGTYTDTLLNAAGCDSILTVSLTIDTVNTIVDQLGFELTAQDTGATYQWLDCGLAYTPITGANSRRYTATQNGDYAVELTRGSCRDTSACINVMGVSIADALELSFQLHTLPAEGSYLLELGQRYRELSWQVYDLAGRSWQQGVLQNRAHLELDISELPAGLYLVQVRADGKRGSVKLRR